MFRFTTWLYILAAFSLCSSQDPACTIDRPEDLTHINGVIVSEDFPNPYPPLPFCSWRITSQNYSDTIVQLTFMSFVVDNEDFVIVYDGPDNTFDVLLAHSDVGLPVPATVYSTGPNMFVEFIGEDPTPSGIGFQAKFTTDRACRPGFNRTIISPSIGYIDTPMYPNGYEPLSNCVCIIRAPVGQVIYIDFPEFNLEDCCSCDFVTLSENYLIVRSYCYDNPPGTYTSSTNEVEVNFASDLVNQSPGFRLYYRFLACVGGNCTTPAPPTTTPPITTHSTTTPSTTTISTTSTSTATTTPSTSTPTISTALPTGTTVPLITEIFMSLVFNATLYTADGQPLDNSCQALYKESLRQTVLTRIVLTNDRIELGTLCQSASEVVLVQSDQSLLTQGSLSLFEADVSLMAYLYHTFGAHHDCAREVVSYWTNASNWQQPIIGQEPGCPMMLF